MLAWDHCPLQANGAVAFDEGLAHILTRFTGEGGKRNRRKCRIHIELKKSPVHGHYQDERHYCDEQPSNERDRPQRDGLKEAAVLDGRYHFSR